MPIIGAFIAAHPPIILPQVGRGEERKIQRTTDAYNEISMQIAKLEPQTIIIVSPHSVLYQDYFHIAPGKSARGDFKRFGVRDVEVKVDYDEDFSAALEKNAVSMGIPAGTLGQKDKSLDHGVLVPLMFINKFNKNYKIVRISMSGLSNIEHYRFGMCISKTADESEKRVVFVASGDLSHKLKTDGPYGFSKNGPEFDKQVTEAISSGDFLKFFTIDEKISDAAAECGLRSFIIMAGALDKKKIKPRLLSYEGTFGVGYAVGAFEIIGDDKQRDFLKIYKDLQKNKESPNQNDYVKLAKLALESYVKEGKKIERPQGLHEDLIKNSAGVFVSIKKFGRLRGCIGTIKPVEKCVADEIIKNAISAGIEDPRFNPVTGDELSSLEYSVDVLGEAEPVLSEEQLDVKRYGVIVSKGWRRGLLLPNLEGVDSVERQVSIALQKAGIGGNEDYKLERFEVVRHK